MKWRNQSAFTLIELMVVIAILAILAALTMSALSTSQCSADVTKITAKVKECRDVAGKIVLGLNDNHTDLRNCARDAMKLAQEMKEKKWWKDNKDDILALWTELREKYRAVQAEHPDWQLPDLPEDPSNGPPQGY